MVKGLIRFSANNRFIVLLATAVVVGYGVYVLTNIPVDEPAARTRPRAPPVLSRRPSL